MKKISKKIIILAIIILFVIFTILGIKLSKSKNLNDEDYENAYSNMKNNSIMYDDNATLQSLKEEYKYTGNDDLYQIETEYDGRKVITVKNEINYNVAFAGLIKKQKPEFSEVEEIVKNYHPKENGVWIENDSKDIILNYLNNNQNLNAKYFIDDDGYLNIESTTHDNENDKKIKKVINGSNQYVIGIAGLNYMVNPVTGDIIFNPYEDLDKEQPYDYFESDNKMIIFITDNIEGKLTNDEIFNSILNLV